MASAAEQLYILGMSHGYTRLDDAETVKILLPPSSPSLIANLASNPNPAVASINLTISDIENLLTAIHVVAAAEAMAFGARVGLDLNVMYKIICGAAGGSKMFETRAPRMLKGSWSPDGMRTLGEARDQLRTVLDKTCPFSPAPMGAAALSMLELAAGREEWRGEADAAVVKVWDVLAGVSPAKAAESA